MDTASRPVQAEQLASLVDEVWEHTLEHSPLLATAVGDFRYNDRLGDNADQALEAEDRAARGFLERLVRIDVEALAQEDRITAQVLRRSLSEQIESHPFHFEDCAIEHLGSPAVWFNQQALGFPFRDAKDAADFLSRQRDFPRWLEIHLEQTRRGLNAGKVPARRVVGLVNDQVRALAGLPADKWPIFQSVEQAKAGLAGAETRTSRGLRDIASKRGGETFRQSIPRRFSSQNVPSRGAEPVEPGASALCDIEKFARDLAALIDAEIRPAFQRYGAFLADELEAHGRDDDHPGISALDRGEEAYRYFCRHYTTTDHEPEEIHRVGHEQMAQLEKEMRAVAGNHGGDADLPAFMKRLVEDPAQHPHDRAELVTLAEDVIARVEAQLPRFFGRLPGTRCIVKPIEEYREASCPAAFYERPRPGVHDEGIYWVNTFQPEERFRFNAAALAVHEAVPGHHLQIALAQELDHLPLIRRHGGATAYIEGWALYCERLCVEMGIYRDDLELFGMLTYQAWRAARLVTDTGLHALGWSRRRALDYYREHLALSETEIANEVDRYIAWPGQALSYKMGELEISALRRESEAALGARFDLRAFHDEVLGHGALPLSVLAGVIRRWAAG